MNPPSRELLAALAAASAQVTAAESEWDRRTALWSAAIRSGDQDRKDAARREHDAAMHRVIVAYAIYFGHAETVRYILERRSAA